MCAPEARERPLGHQRDAGNDLTPDVSTPNARRGKSQVWLASWGGPNGAARTLSGRPSLVARVARVAVLCVLAMFRVLNPPTRTALTLDGHTQGVLYPSAMPSFATADAGDSKRSKAKEASKTQSAAGGRKPVKQIIIWTGIICVIALLINWNVSRLQTTAKSGRGGGSVQSSVSAQGDTQCISPHKGDTPTAVCQAFCSEKFVKFHCKWCKCRACSFCPKGGEAIEEAARSDANASAVASNASTATANPSPASAPPAATFANAMGTDSASLEGELGPLLAVSGAGGSVSAGTSAESSKDGNATAGTADASSTAAATTGGDNTTVTSTAETVVGSGQVPAGTSVVGGPTADGTVGQASASDAVPTATTVAATAATAARPPSEQPTQQTLGGTGAAAVVLEEVGGDEALDEGFDADAELLGLDA